MSSSPTRNNNIGFIRLLAASMVIISHSAEMIDGDRSRELLTRLFGTLSFGGFGVDIFFLISGYLITKSYLTGGGRLYYLIKRANRIYPGFLVAYFICIFVVAPLAGIKLMSLSPADWGDTIYRAFRLGMPALEGAFASEHYHFLNAPMWTISCEFRCYLFVMLIGALGIYKRRFVFLALPLVFLGLYIFVVNAEVSSGTNIVTQLLIGDLDSFFRFMFVFSCGASFYLFEDKIKYTGIAAIVSTLALVGCMFSAKLAEPALCTFGAYVLFYLAFKTKHVKINNSYDISYGVYLYAWPIAALTILYHPAITPVYLFCFTLVLALIAGTISWFLVEKPAASLLRHLPGRIKTGPVFSPLPESAAP